MQKHVNLVDLVKSFPTPTSIYLQNLASIQKRTSPVKFAHLAEKSGKGSISDLSTKGGTAESPRPRAGRPGPRKSARRSATRSPGSAGATAGSPRPRRLPVACGSTYDSANSIDQRVVKIASSNSSISVHQIQHEIRLTFSEYLLRSLSERSSEVHQLIIWGLSTGIV